MSTKWVSIFAAASLLFAGGNVLAHDHWINHGGYMMPLTAPAAGDYTGPTGCCGDKDCDVVEYNDVTVVGNFYHIRSLGEYVPFEEVEWSPDGQYWRCQNNNTGKRKCFFAPVQSVMKGLAERHWRIH